MKTPRFFWRQFPKFMENKYFVWHAVDTRPLLPSITVQRTIKLIRIVLGFWAPICIKLGKGTLFSSNMITSFHTVLFLQRIRKILKLFCHFWLRMRVQVDRPKGLNSQDLFYFVSRTNKRTSRTEFIGSFSLGVQRNLQLVRTIKNYLKSSKCLKQVPQFNWVFASLYRILTLRACVPFTELTATNFQ